MNLPIRGIDSDYVKWNSEGSLLNDAHRDLKANFILANPPFNDSDWGGDSDLTFNVQWEKTNKSLDHLKQFKYVQ